jgi:hypothetical protein
MKKVLDRIEIKQDLKFDNYEDNEYSYIEVHLLDDNNNLLEIWKWRTEGDIPDQEEFCEKTGCKIGVSTWITQ